MPQRKSVQRVEGWDGQGDDSFVVVARPSVGLMEEIQAMSNIEDKTAKENISAGKHLIAQCVLEWNWVNNAGKPLAQVPDNPDVINELTDQEMAYLMALLTPDEADIKKKPTNSGKRSGLNIQTRKRR